MCLEISLNCSIYPHDSSAAFWCQTSRENPKRLQERSPALHVLSTFSMHDLNYFPDWEFCFATRVLCKWCKATPVALLVLCPHAGKWSQYLLPSLHQCCGFQQKKTEAWEQKGGHGMVCSGLNCQRLVTECLGVESRKASGSLLLWLNLESWSLCQEFLLHFTSIHSLGNGKAIFETASRTHPSPERRQKWSEFSKANRRITTQAPVSLEEIKLCPDIDWNRVHFLAVRLLHKKEQTSNNHILIQWDLPFLRKIWVT